MKIDDRIAVALILIGLTLLTTAEYLHTPKKTAVTALSTDNIGDQVTITGKINTVREADETTFINLASRPDLTIVTFTDLHDIHINDTVTITGRVEMYEGQLEIVADTVQQQNS